MATNDSSNSISAATLGIKPVSLHQHHDWLMPTVQNHPDAVFASKVVDVARGAHVIASIVCAHLVDLNAIAGGAPDVIPLLSENDIEALARLAVRSLNDLHQLADSRVDHFNSLADGVKS